MPSLSYWHFPLWTLHYFSTNHTPPTIYTMHHFTPPTALNFLQSIKQHFAPHTLSTCTTFTHHSTPHTPLHHSHHILHPCTALHHTTFYHAVLCITQLWITYQLLHTTFLTKDNFTPFTNITCWYLFPLFHFTNCR